MISWCLRALVVNLSFPLHSMPHEPGAPPQRPHIGSIPEDFPVSLATANTLMTREVCAEPHSGHFTPRAVSLLLMARAR